VAGERENEYTVRVAPTDRQVRIMSVALVVVDGPSRGLHVTVRDGAARVGSGPAAHLQLNDKTVSRVHCELRVRPDGILLKDCGSTNGTYVEGVRLVEGEVRPGALVRCGASVFRIEDEGGDVFLPLSERRAFGEIVGDSIEMRRVYSTLERVAGTSSTVLVEGETGTGKDVVARSLHQMSTRSRGPYVPIDCGAIPVTLIESELFGHMRGAFSGAHNDRRGVFEEADGGTLFLDEVGELPLHVQPKLLRALEMRAVRRLGGNQEKAVDVRIVAATNRSLARCVNEGTFREDLYYRLAVVEVTLPPLRSRREDIATLAKHFYTRLGGTTPLPPDFLAMLAARGWPGNVRELRNYMERAVSLGLVNEANARPSRMPPPLPTEPVATSAGIESMVPLHLPLKEARDAWTENFENIYVRSLLKKTNGNLTRAAEAAGVNRRFMQRLVARLGIKASRDESEGLDPLDLDDG
jgi:transcriptional regulator with GAF, ATPase, and Fis domain